ncbi:MAG: hypothetical protein ABIQ55_06595 [Gemmatimonadaceae bacterium]
MIGQLPPFALATPAFRFKALASHAGRASLGGDREVALACFVSARLIAGLLPPLAIGSVDSATRAAAARQWLASIAVPAPTRAAATLVLDAVADHNFGTAGKALRMLIEAGKAQLDQASVDEMTELVNEVTGAALPAA